MDRARKGVAINCSGPAAGCRIAHLCSSAHEASGRKLRHCMAIAVVPTRRNVLPHRAESSHRRVDSAV